MTWFRCFILALAFVAASAELNLVDTAKDLIEDFRDMMRNGRDDLGIPILEPVFIKQLPISVKQSPFDATCVASEIIVPGISGFEFTHISQVPSTNTLKLDVSVPDIPVTASYDLSGKVKVGFLNIKLTGSGPLTVHIGGLKGSGTVDVVVNRDNSLSLSDLQIVDWTYKKINIHLDNLLGGGVMGNTVNSLVNSLVPSVLNSNKALISKLIRDIGLQYINLYLGAVTGQQRIVLSQNIVAEAVTQFFNEEEWIISEETQTILDELAMVAVGFPLV